MKLNDDFDNLEEFELEINNRGFLSLWQQFQEESANGLSYERIKEWQNIFKPHGLIFDFGLDADPYAFDLNTENSRLIPLFLGYTLKNTSEGLAWESPFKLTKDDILELHGRLEKRYVPKFENYFRNWNRLIAIILIIGDKTGFTLVMEENTSYWVNSGEFIDNEPQFGGYNNIENIYEACVEFIKWYNLHTTNIFYPPLEIKTRDRVTIVNHDINSIKKHR